MHFLQSHCNSKFNEDFFFQALIQTSDFRIISPIRYVSFLSFDSISHTKVKLKKKFYFENFFNNFTTYPLSEIL